MARILTTALLAGVLLAHGHRAAAQPLAIEPLPALALNAPFVQTPNDGPRPKVNATKTASFVAIVAGVVATGLGVWLLSMDGRLSDCVPTNQGDQTVCTKRLATASAGWASVSGGSGLVLAGVGGLVFRW